jgi:hypothetical protein
MASHGESNAEEPVENASYSDDESDGDIDVDHRWLSLAGCFSSTLTSLVTSGVQISTSSK